MLFVNALCIAIKLVPNANRTILLPSLLYKVGRDKKRDEAVYAFFEKHSLESFIKKLINDSELRVVKENIPQCKPTKKARDYATQVEREKREKKELALRNEDVLSLNSCREDKQNAQSLRELSNNEDQLFITDKLGEVAAPATGSRVPCDDKLSPETSYEDDLKEGSRLILWFCCYITLYPWVTEFIKWHNFTNK